MITRASILTGKRSFVKVYLFHHHGDWCRPLRRCTQAGKSKQDICTVLYNVCHTHL